MKMSYPHNSTGDFDKNQVEFQSAFTYISAHKRAKKMKILTNLIQSIQLKIYGSSKEFKKRNLPLEMGDVLKNASRVLICLPAEPADAQAAVDSVGKMSRAFPSWTITVLTSESNAAAFLQKSKWTLLTYAEDELAKSAKPKKKFVQEKLKPTFDVAIDLSIAFSFTNLVVAWLSGSQLRVGFHHQDRETLYNFLVRHKAEASPEHSYQSLLTYLLSFH